MEKQSGVGRFFRAVDLLWKLFAVGVYGTFLIMKIARGTGIFAINVSLLAVNGIYALALCIRAIAGGGKVWKKRIDLWYRWGKLFFSLASLLITAYSIVTAVSAPDPFEITFAILNGAVLFTRIFFAVCAALVRAKFAKRAERRRVKREEKGSSLQKKRGGVLKRALKWLWFGEPFSERETEGEEQKKNNVS